MYYAEQYLKIMSIFSMIFLYIITYHFILSLIYKDDFCCTLNKKMYLLFYHNVIVLILSILGCFLEYQNTRISGHYAPLLLAPAEDLGALGALLGTFGPLLSSSIKSILRDGCLDT